MPLNDMLRLGLEKHINLLKDISSRASKEFALEKVSRILRGKRVKLMTSLTLLWADRQFCHAESVADGQGNNFGVLL